MKAFTSRWFISFIGVALVAALVWFYAPLVPQLEGGLIRSIILVILVTGLGLRQPAAGFAARTA